MSAASRLQTCELELTPRHNAVAIRSHLSAFPGTDPTVPATSAYCEFDSCDTIAYDDATDVASDGRFFLHGILPDFM